MRERIRGKARIRARGLGDVYEIGEIVGEVVSEVTSAIGEAIAEAVSAAAGVWRGGSVKVEIEEEVFVVDEFRVDIEKHVYRLHEIVVKMYRETG